MASKRGSRRAATTASLASRRSPTRETAESVELSPSRIANTLRLQPHGNRPSGGNSFAETTARRQQHARAFGSWSPIVVVVAGQRAPVCVGVSLCLQRGVC